ncbi:MAG TPA: sigma-70 family RNA polymerase sigma factor, partial [Myxococcota bacterium]|nr:sigma-70 family RNA polymerase sigma factor [Myxococcota bacterium]
QLQLAPTLKFTPQRRWAMTILDQALAALRGEFEGGGKLELFAQLQGSLTGATDTPPYAALAERLGMTEGAVKVAAHRMRQRYGQILREQIARTVLNPSEVDEELRHLLTALSQ